MLRSLSVVFGGGLHRLYRVYDNFPAPAPPSPPNLVHPPPPAVFYVRRLLPLLDVQVRVHGPDGFRGGSATVLPGQTGAWLHRPTPGEKNSA